MNENSSKQVLLSVLGIAVLVVAVVGVSFAFFSYSKTGDSSNVLTTGSIVFNFVEGDAINLTNEFPRTDGNGLVAGTGANGVLSFSIEGYDGSGTGIDYTIKAVPGSVAAANRFKDTEIKLWLTGTNKGASPVTNNNFSTPAKVSTQGTMAANTPITLASGKITSTDAEQPDEHNYELRMWIDAETVKINDQDTVANDSTYTNAEFSTMYYSIQLKVDANSTGA